MNKPKHILVLTYWELHDALIQTYTLPYLRIIRSILPEGSSIHLITFEKTNPVLDEVLLEEGIYHRSFQQFPFGIKAILARLNNSSTLQKYIREKNIDTIHTWCTPAGALGWKLSKKTGVPLILDSYEPHAEAMLETGTWKRNSIAFQLLFKLEKKQTHHAKWLIGVVPAMKEYALKKYGYSGNNFLFKPACIDFDKFNLKERKKSSLLKELGLENKIVCVYAGKFGGLYLREEAFLFFKKCFDHFGENFRILLLTSTKREEIDSLCRNAGINSTLVLSKFVDHSLIPRYLGLGDFAFSAFKPVPSRKYCTPIKNGEYWAMGLPVIIPAGISEDSEIIASSQTGIVLGDFSVTTIEKAIIKLGKILKNNSDGKLSETIHELAVKHRNFSIAASIYRKIYQE